MPVVTPNFWVDDGSSVYPKASRNIKLPANKYFISSTVKGEDYYGDDILTDGVFDYWVTQEIPDNFDSESTSAEVTNATLTKTEDSYEGDYAVQMHNYSFEDMYILWAPISTQTGGDELEISCYAKTTSEDGVFFAVVEYEQEGSGDDYYWNFSGDDVGTWTRSSDYIDVVNEDMEDWTGNTLDNWTFSAAGPGSPTLEKETTIVNYGSAAAKITPDAGTAGVLLSPAVSGLTSGESYEVSIYLYGADTTVALVVLNSVQSHVYNWNTSSWDVWGGSPGEGQTQDISGGTGVYNKNDRTFSAYTDGTAIIGLIGDDTSVVYMDTVRLRSNSGGGPSFETQVFISSALSDTYQKITLSNNPTYPDDATEDEVGVLIGGISSESGEAVVLLDKLEIINQETSTDIAQNGDFEDWTTYYVTPEYWDVDGWTENTDSEDIDGSSTVKYSGIASVRCHAHGDPSQAEYFSQLKTSLTPEDEYHVTYYTRKSTGASGNAIDNLVILNDEESSATQIYNWTLEQWDAYTPGSGIPGEDYISGTDSLTESFALFESENFEVPASGKVNIILFCLGDGGDDETRDYVYFDNVTLNEFIEQSEIVLFPYISLEDADNLGADDDIFVYETVGGDGKEHFRLTGDGKFKTDNNNFDFTDKPTKVSGANVSTNADCSISYIDMRTMAPVILGTASVDFKTTGAYDLYTIPSGYEAIITDIIVKTTSVTGYASGPTYNIGFTAPNYTDIIDSSITVSDTSGEYTHLPLASVGYFPTASSSSFKVNVTSGATADVMAGLVTLIGYLKAIEV